MTSKRVSLLTIDSGTAVTGGHMYNRHMIEVASGHGFEIETVPVHRPFNPRGVRGLVVIDSLVAWKVGLGVFGRTTTHPLVALVHQVPGGVSGPTLLRLVRRTADLALYRRCDLVIAASSFLGREITSGGIPPERIRVVPPGRDVLQSGQAIGSSGPRIEGRLNVLNVANWVQNKGILELLEAVESIPSNQIVLHLVGSCDMSRRYAKRVRARLNDEALRQKVVVHGPVPKDRIGHFYNEADVVALTSGEEGYGTVIAEALGSGVPVIAWDSGNLPNLFEDGAAGFLIPPGDISAVTEALRLLAGDDDLRSSLSTQAARRGSELPTWSQSECLFFEALHEMAG